MKKIRLNIFNRLVIALITAIAVLVGFGIFTIIRIDHLASVTKKIYADPLKISKTANETRVDVLKVQREVKDLLLVSDKSEGGNIELEVVKLINKVQHHLDVINHGENKEEILMLGEEIEALFFQWRYNKEELMALNQQGRDQEASALSRNNNHIVEEIEERLLAIAKIAEESATNLVDDAFMIEQSLKFTAITIMATLGIFLIILFAVIIRSILSPINILKNSMNKSIETGELRRVDLKGDNEIVEISKYYNMLIRKLQDQFWIKDSENHLNQEITGDIPLTELTEKALNYIARTVDAGKGAFYIYYHDQRNLRLTASFAFTERESLSNVYQLGEGVVGQVALERKAILLKNINRKDECINTGLYKEAPTNTYTFPLVLENKLYGVIELASFNELTAIKKEFLNQASDIITVCLNGALQGEKIRNLLKISEEAQREAKIAAEDLQKANIVLEEQQQQLQQQTAELQQTNAELEEQQQLLQHQSEELQKTNSQLEEQQQILEQQASLLNMKNSELERTKDELIRYSQNLELGNRYKTEFLANMSHELRTPLNSIILLSRLLMNNKNGMIQEDLEKIAVINNSGQELLRLIDDILDLSKIEAGKIDINKIEFRTNDLVKEARQLFDKLAEEKGIRFYVEDLLVKNLKGDRDKISQILRNLISNAIKFTEEGSVIFRLEPDPVNPKAATFTVVDTGIGIAKENLSRIFEAFQQGDGSISRRFGGTGLGLSISKKLAELMGGKILVDSKPHKGSSFSLYLPNIISEGSYLDQELEILQESAATKEESMTSVSHKVILIIEDDPNFAEYISEINKELGLKTIIAKTGKAGLDYLKDQRIDGVLLDLMLPDISGIDVLNEIKNTPELKHLPVQIISSWKKSSVSQDIGEIPYKEKPMDTSEIKNIVKELVNLQEENQKLLVIMDDENQLDSIHALFKDQNIRLKGSTTVEDAKKQLDAEEYDAIILDFDVTKEEGINVCRELNNLNLDTPVIIYAGEDLTEDQEKEIKKYCNRIVVKTANSKERLIDEVTLFLHKLKNKTDQSPYLISKTNIEHSLRLDGKKILIVDDDTRNIFVLATALEEYGAEILEAENGKAALATLKENNIDLVLMDIMMPVMNGFDTIKAIRSDEILRDIPVIAITAKSLKEDRERCIIAGANDYISKPVDYDTLIRLVKAWIDKRS
ncbi:response regulator [Alkaliphilus transvaalensis]|uniref:response regulator n=1 Tax=Alkaliphilus transvaalensis TaxID=114628 RepID=UPI0006864413|nr:response regulator [Alkaliphilus transvaalensis]